MHYEETNRSQLGRLQSLLLFLLMATFSLAPLYGQTDTARIQGSVVDKSGATVQGARITVTSADTGATVTTTSDANGNFTFGALNRGSYTAEIKQEGFETQSARLTLDVSQVQALNFVLIPGAVSTSVEVTDAAPLLETATSSTGTVVEGRQLTELPLNGRNFIQLALLSPGVTRGAYGNQASGVSGNAETLRNNETGGASITANGIRPQANNFILDGLDNNESLVNTINFFPPVEAMQEFKVTTTVAPAEFGRAGGAIVQSSIKSGTNAIHGSGFWFYRDQYFDASPNYFSPNTPVAGFHRNQYGGTIGGPLWKNHIFAFGDYQALSQNRPVGVTVSTTPTAKMRTGDFSELLGTGLTLVPNLGYTNCPNGFRLDNGNIVKVTTDLTSSGGSGAIFDPLTCAQFPGNVIPTSRLNSAAVNYLNAFPDANRASANTQNNYANTQIEEKNYKDFDIRLDFTFGQKDTFFGRYSYAQDNQTKTTRYVGLPSGFGTGDNNTHPRGVAVGYNHVFTPAILNEFRFGYSRPYFGYLNPFEGVPFSQNLGILNANRNKLLGGGALIGGNDGEIGYTGDGGPYTVPQHSYQFLDTLNWNRGVHSMKFGANVMQRQVDFFQADYRSKGFFNIAGNGADYTGYEVTELLAAFVDNYSIANPTGAYNTRSWETGYFAQDDWKVSRRLTLNLGLRYDLYTWPYETANRQSNFDLSTGALNVAAKNGNSRSLIDTNHNNWAPRIGFAYDVTGKGKTVARGGYGIFYFLDRGGVGNQLSNNPDFNGASQYTSAEGYRITFNGQGPLFNNNNLDATATLPSANFTINEAHPVNAAVLSYPKKNPTSVIQQWNIQIEQQLSSNTVLDIAYVGTKQDHLANVINYTNHQLATGDQFFSSQGLGVTLNTDNGSGTYNGMQVKVERHMAQGLQFTGAYTYSHALDNSTGAFSPTGSSSTIFVDATGPLLQYNYGNSGDDQRQAAVISALYELPFGRGKQFGKDVSRPVDLIIGGWQINPFLALGTGTPFDLSTNSAGNVNNRPDQVSNPHLGLGPNLGGKRNYINASAFTDPPVNAAGIYYRPGMIDRNRYYGPGYKVLNASIFKNIPITERVMAQLRFEGYNVTNTPQFANPYNTNINQPGDFGDINSTRYFSERQLQFGAHITF